MTIVALTRRRQCAPTGEIFSAKSRYSRQDLFAPFYEMRSGPGWVGTSDIFIGQFTLDPAPAESHRLFGSILLELEGIAEDGRAINLDGIGWHAPTGRAPQLDALELTICHASNFFAGGSSASTASAIALLSSTRG